MKCSILKATLALALTGLAASGCRDGGPGDLVEISGKLFVFNYRVATARYLVTLKPVAPVDDGVVAVATFENPDGGTPVVVRRKIWPKSERTVLESDPVRCVLADRPYQVEIRIEDPKGAELQLIRTTITSSVDQEVLPDRPLFVGPVYTRNPELVGRPGGKLDVTNETGCPGRG